MKRTLASLDNSSVNAMLLKCTKHTRALIVHYQNGCILKGDTQKAIFRQPTKCIKFQWMLTQTIPRSKSHLNASMCYVAIAFNNCDMGRRIIFISHAILAHNST